MACEFSLLLVGQQPLHCAQNLFCSFNQKAAPSDPAEIHKYSEDLIGLIVSNSVDANSVPQAVNHLTDRLASAEQTARAGSGKRVPEAAVVKAFNNLMQEIGAPPSMRASEASVHKFREHAVSINAFPALFTATRNGANCNPGEAVFFLYLLISNSGVLSEQDLDLSVALMHKNSQRTKSGSGFLTGHMEVSEASASILISSYSLHHDHKATIALFNHAADILGF
jgi:hypothetical protein